MHILSRFKLIKTFVFDMDGILTDGSLFIDSENNWLRQMNIKDGYALQLAVKSGFEIMVITGSHSPEIKERLNRLGITDMYMNITEKEKFLKEKTLIKNWDLKEVLFMGDDIPDFACMKIAGIAACPADAVFEIKEIASYISPFKGGQGCVRDVIEKVLKLNKMWPLSTSVPSM